MNKFYVAGGEYWDGTKYVFHLVGPGFNAIHGKPMPYVTDNAEGVKLTDYHSHVYELSEDGKSVRLVLKRDELILRATKSQRVLAPLTATLNEEEAEGVAYNIESGNVF